MDDIAIKISAKNQAKNELAALRKDIKALEKAIAEASDPAEIERLTKAYQDTQKAIAEATDKVRKLTRDVDAQRKSVRTLSGAWERVKSSVVANQRQIQLWGIAAAAAIGVVMKKAIDAASNLAESKSKVDAVFGDKANAVLSWANDSATAFGQSKQQSLEAASTYGNLFQAFGVGRGKATEMSTSLVQLAADLASFNNTSVDDALEALRSGLSGETEPLKRFGVALVDDRLKQEALNQRIYDGTGILTAAQKAQAAYALIMKDTALAQGDFARTSDQLANSQRIAKAEYENALATIGETGIPIMIKAAQAAATLARIIDGMPEPLRMVVLGVTALGVAGMVLLPRILAIRAATKAWTKSVLENAAAQTRAQRATALGGAALGGLISPVGLATLAVGALAVGLGAYFQAQSNAKAAADGFAGTLDEITGKATEATYAMAATEIGKDVSASDIALLQQYGVSLADLAAAAVDGGNAYTQMKAKLDELETKGAVDGIGQLNSAAVGAAVSITNQNEVVEEGRITQQAAAAAQLAASRVTERATAMNTAYAYAQEHARRATEARTAAEQALASGFDKASQIMARALARRRLAEAKDAFAKKATAENAIALTQASMDYAQTLKNPEKQLVAIGKQFPEIKTSIEKSGINKALKTDLVASLNAVESAANDAAAAVASIGRGTTGSVYRALQVSSRVDYADAGRGGPTVMKAAGGLVTGPGTGTSDSIAARVSNGEYVVRAAAVGRIGVGALDRLNWIDRIPGGVRSIDLSGHTIGSDGPHIDPAAAAPIVLDAGHDAPLVGVMHVQTSSEIDMLQVLSAQRRRDERARRSRYANA